MWLSLRSLFLSSFLILSALGTGCTGNATAPADEPSSRTFNVATVPGLTSAIANAQPGDSINVAAGTYTLAAPLSISQSGTANRPITITGAGTGRTIINVNQQPVSHTASYVVIRKLRMTNFHLRGYWFLSDAHHNVMDSVEVDHALNHAIALRDSSHHNIIQHCLVHDTGIQNPQWGEGVYVGGKDVSTGAAFVTLDNQILGCHFGPNVRAQAVDISSGADRTTVRGNFIDGTGTEWIPSAGSATLIGVTASDNVIDGNFIQYGSPRAITFYAPVGYPSSGNLVTNNFIDLQNIHNATTTFYAIDLTAGTTSPSSVIVKCSNTVINGLLSNVPCTP